MPIDQVADIEWPTEDGEYLVVQAIVRGKYDIEFQSLERTPISRMALEAMLKRRGITDYPKIDFPIHTGLKIPASDGPDYNVIGMGMAFLDSGGITVYRNSDSIEYGLKINIEHLDIVKRKYPDKKIKLL